MLVSRDHDMFCTFFAFGKLIYLPMASMVKQIQCLEESAESLRERSLKFSKGCRKYT